MIYPGVMAALAILTVPIAGPVNAPVSSPGVNQYDAAFDKSFPEVSGAHHVVDWKLYTAIVAGDIVSYATKLDPAVANRFALMKGKGYQLQLLEENIKQDKLVRGAFDDHRRRIASMTLYSDGNGTETEPCPHALVYVANEFRLVLSEIPWNENPLAGGTVAPTCPQTVEPGFQLTAGRSSRFKCWTVANVATCGWRLPDMPVDLKRVIESEYPASIKVRWTWKGLGGRARVRQLDMNGNRVAERDGVGLTVPSNLGLEFVDDMGQIRWRAVAAGMSGGASSRRRP